MTLLAYFIGSLALAAGTGLVIVALIRLEHKEADGYVSKGHPSRFQTKQERLGWPSRGA